MKRNSPEKPPPVPQSKKTRELPNILDCNCCNRRTNNTNPKSRIRILTSEWRIVLLCKSCYNLVESSQFCSYCLSRVSSCDPYFDCKKCRRRIHDKCVDMYEKFGFGRENVCFDCWMPNLVENEYKRDRVRKIVNGSSKKRKLEKVSDGDEPKIRVPKPKEKEKRKRVENVVKNVKNADVFADRKIVFAMEARPKAVGKAIEAKRVVEIASGALKLVAVEKESIGTVDQDVGLAIKLHRSMNSLPRIAGNVCLLNTHCEDVPELESGVGAYGTGCLSKVGKGEGSLMGREPNGLCLSGGIKQECGESNGKMQNGKCNGCRITYVRKRRASMHVKVKKEPVNVKYKEEPHECSLKVYCRKLSQAEKHGVDYNNCSQSEKRKLDASHFSQFEKCNVDAKHCSQVKKHNLDASYFSQAEKCNVDDNHCSKVEERFVDGSQIEKCNGDASYRYQVGKLNGDAVHYSQVEKLNGDANRCSQVQKCNVDVSYCSQVEKLNRDASHCFQVEKLNGDASHCFQVEKRNEDPSRCSKTYIRKNLRCKSTLLNGSLNLEDGNP